MSINTANGHKIVEFDIRSISGSQAIGAYLLRFSIEYLVPPQGKEQTLFHKTSAKVYVGEENVLLGVASPEQPITFRPIDHLQKAGILYEVMMSRDALDEIEKIRSGGDLNFKLDIAGEYYDDFNKLGASDSITYRANQKEWIEVLKQMQYRGGLVFELPMDIQPAKEVESALAAIKKAKEHLYYGNYDDVVAKCRIALEVIVSSWGDIQALRKAASTNRKGMSKEKRFVSAIDSIVHFTNLAHHPSEEGEYVSYSRSEAVFVLGSTISAISSYAEDKR